MNIINEHCHMWPRDVYHFRRNDEKSKVVDEVKNALQGKPGLYVLFRDDVPYYVGRANCLFSRVRDHALDLDSSYCRFWNYFSAFMVSNQEQMAELEALLIAVTSTGVNGEKPELSGRIPLKGTLKNALKERSFIDISEI